MPAIVWFKRDLRLLDHEPLVRAAAHGTVVPLYIVEPGLWQQPDLDAQHWRWVRASLTELRAGLAELGAPLVVRSGEAVEVLEALRRDTGATHLFSHQETGNAWTFARDRAVARWARAQGVSWHQPPQHGVVRGLVDRDGWSKHWEARMSAEACARPTRLQGSDLDPGDIPLTPRQGLDDLHPAVPARRADQTPGEGAALDTLRSFLDHRGARYHLEMSSPATAYQACSRLSAPLAWGNLSMRHVVQTTRAAQRDLKARDGQGPDGAPYARRALSAFGSRLHWHCHFMQKLESEPELEQRCFNRALDDVRPRPGDPVLLEAWKTGRTGLPFVDACMRSLQIHGWINFRMRAMLVAVAAYHLWLDWREFRDFLARQFVDYEPGIHISQIQMQSGVTGINTLRIYNPVKQGFDQDPDGAFIRQWLPELAHLDTPALHEPWTLESVDYPARVVDHMEAARAARRQLGTALSAPDARAESERVMREHGSRAGARRPRRTSKGGKQHAEQRVDRGA